MCEDSENTLKSWISDERISEDVQLAKSGDTEAVARLISASEGLIRWTAKRYLPCCGPSADFDDLMQEGRSGLFKAIELYDPNKGTSFFTYAVYWIKHDICSLALYRSHSVRLPPGLVSIKIKIAALQNEAPENRLSSSCLAEALNLPQKTIDRALTSNTDTVSLDKPIGEEEDSSLGDIIADLRWIPLEEISERNSAIQFIDRLIKQFLNDQERLVIFLRYGFIDDIEYSVESTAQKLNLSPQKVTRLENRAIRKMKRQFFHYGMYSLYHFYLRFM